jgi:pimeloyl-ACP methyl ester carboxylesterase
MDFKSAEIPAATGRRGTRGTPGGDAAAKMTARVVATGGRGDARVYSLAGPHSKSGNPVFVLLHGIGMSHRYYRRLQRILAGHGEVHSFDLPGFGAAAKPDRQMSVAEYAAVIAGALVELGTGPVVVVGHSMGTQFATELALIRPDLVSHVVLIGPVVDSARRSVLLQALALGANSLTESPAGNAIVFTDYVRSGIRWYLTELPVMMSYDLEARLSRLAQPVLVVRGSRDTVAPRPWCQKVAAIAAHGHFLEIPGKPHIVQHGAATRMAAGILAFTRS